jgi:hypothetical protein
MQVTRRMTRIVMAPQEFLRAFSFATLQAATDGIQNEWLD